MQENGNIQQRYYDEHTLYMDSGVATKDQISNCLKTAILEAEKVLERKLNCTYRINVLVNKNGEYFGYAYIWVSSTEVYWILLGRNPDGTERFEEIPDPNWKPSEPLENNDNNDTNDKKKSWYERIEEEERFIQPLIKKLLPPLVIFPGYTYNKEQLEHLKEVQKTEQIENPQKIEKNIPEMGFFEISRAYALDPASGFMSNRLCARNVPKWIPKEAFKSIFSFYVGKNDKYPIVDIVEHKKGGRIVFITYDPKKRDTLFVLLMTKKTIIKNPENPEEKAVLIFTHAYNNPKN